MLSNVPSLFKAGTVAIYLSVGGIGVPIYTYKCADNSVSLNQISESTTRLFINESIKHESITKKSFPSGFFTKKRRHATANYNISPMQLDDDVLNGKKHIHLDVK